MEYKRFGNVIFVRMDRDEEIHEQLKKVALRENIKLASVNALGALKEFTSGVYNTTEKKYYSNSFEGAYEIVSLTGTITTKAGEYYPHLHISCGDSEGRVFGGHMNRAVISATCEMVITCVDGTVEREYEDSIGLNLFKF